MTSDELTSEERLDLVRAFIATALKIENPEPILILAKGDKGIANLVIGDHLEVLGMMECFKHHIIGLDFGPPKIIEEVNNPLI